MCETELLRPSTFYVQLHVDSDDDDNDDDDWVEPEPESLTTKSWKVQLCRLLQSAPQPLPVLCDEPRCFPHFESERKLSGTSWTSDITYFTDVTVSDATSAVSIRCTEKGANENYQTTAVSEDNSSQKSEISLTGEAKDAVGESVSTSMKTGIEICLNGNSVNNVGEENEEVSNSHSLLQESSSSKVQDCRQHQLRKDEESSGSRSLSIQVDSEYWEKFRYSKDYQSSLLLETICNEVFNLKPSPRYKSLMKLSETCKKKRTSKDKKEIELPPKLLAAECNDDNDEKGIKVERLETAEEPAIQGEESVSTLKIYTERLESDKHMKGKVENVIISFQKEQHQQMDNAIEDTNDDDENGMEKARLQRQQLAERETRNSITSSVLTTTTATTECAIECQRRHKERMLLLDDFGQAFHGYLTKRETERLLRNDGQYLIRQLWNEEGFILSFMFESKIRNYRLLCDIEIVERPSGGTLGDGSKNAATCTYFLEDRRKCYHSVDELVREGLTTLHLNENAGSYIDLLVELAQFQRNDNLLQTPPAVITCSRKTSRSSSFRMARLPSSSSVIGSAGTSIDCGGGGGNGVNMPSITDGRISMVNTPSFALDNIALLIHYFEDEVFDGLAKCQVCTKGIWGSSNKGLRCRDCRLTLHESCTDNVVKSGCKPDLTILSPFSTDLTTLVKGSRTDSTNESHGPPYILRTCINEVETRGLTTEGIYRICGSAEDIEKLKNLFEKDKIDTSLSECSDINSITGLIKFFLRQLPDPLITEDVFEEFTNNNNSETGEMKIDAVRTLVHSLPPAHRLTLKYLAEHFKRVTMEKTSNKMNAFNLSSVLMPSILGPANFSFNVLESGTKLLYFLITRPEEIF